MSEIEKEPMYKAMKIIHSAMTKYFSELKGEIVKVLGPNKDTKLDKSFYASFFKDNDDRIILYIKYSSCFRCWTVLNVSFPLLDEKIIELLGEDRKIENEYSIKSSLGTMQEAIDSLK